MRKADAFDVELVQRTRRMLATGHPRFSVQALGRELHVPRSTIYRRWSSGTALVGAALSQAISEALSEPPKVAKAAVETRLAEAWMRIAAFASSAEGRMVARVIVDDDPAQRPSARLLRRDLATHRDSLVELFRATGHNASEPELRGAADLHFGSAWCRALATSAPNRAEAAMTVDLILRGSIKGSPTASC